MGARSVNRRSSRRDRHDADRARGYWQERAPQYDRTISFFERLLFSGGREWACSQAHGAVLEVAAGTGRNLPHYPPDAQLTITDFSSDMLEIARRRARDLQRRADFAVEDAGSLSFPDARFDAVVCTLGLCSVPDDARAVAETARVLRPGGKLILLEHVRSPSGSVRFVQSLLNVPSVRFCCDHLTREPLDHLHTAGLEVSTLERSKLGIVERVSAYKRG